MRTSFVLLKKSLIGSPAALLLVVASLLESPVLKSPVLISLLEPPLKFRRWRVKLLRIDIKLLRIDIKLPRIGIMNRDNVLRISSPGLFDIFLLDKTIQMGPRL